MKQFITTLATGIRDILLVQAPMAPMSTRPSTIQPRLMAHPREEVRKMDLIEYYHTTGAVTNPTNPPPRSLQNVLIPQIIHWI